MLASPSCIDLIHIITNCCLETNALCLKSIQNESKGTNTQRICTKINSGFIYKKCHFTQQVLFVNLTYLEQVFFK